MTSPELVSRVRTILDEASPSNWQDEEIYRALADGQRELISLVSGINKKAEVLRPLNENVSDTLVSVSAVNLPADYFTWIRVRYSRVSTLEYERYPCHVRPIEETDFRKDNTYLKSSAFSTDLFFNCYINKSQIVFDLTTTAEGSYDMDYIKMPSDIYQSTAPAIGVTGHKALVYYALYDLFSKDENLQAAGANYQKFLNEIQSLARV